MYDQYGRTYVTGSRFGMLGKAVLVVAMALLAQLPCQAQFNLRTVTGVVTDKRGNVLPGAVVQLEDSVTLSIRSYITGKDGRYHFSELNDDIDYTLKARYRKYWSETKTLSRFNSSTHPEVNLVIPID